MDSQLRTRLLGMAAEDARVRTQLLAGGELFRGYAPRMEEVHRHNAQALEEIVEQYGWPGRSLVGDDGADAAWLILQHAIGHPDLQRSCLPLLKNAVASGDIDPAHPAYLEDRICVLEGRPQRYGTSFDWDENGELNPHPLQDPERVDAYRASVGLGPLAQRIAEARRRAATECETPPADFARRQQEMDAWARSVGWR